MIEINNLTTTPVDKKFLKKVGQKVLEGEAFSVKATKNKKKKKIDLSIVLIGQKKIRELNKNYRKKDRVTDALSFKYDSSGEIVICPEVLRENAEKFKSTFKKELARVLIHGILHLLGYDHEKSIAGAKKMSKKENYYLSHLKS